MVKTNTNRANLPNVDYTFKQETPAIEPSGLKSVCSVLSVCDITKDQGKAFQAIVCLYALPSRQGFVLHSSKRIIYSQYLGIEFIIRQMGIEIFFCLFAYSGFCGNGATNGCR